MKNMSKRNGEGYYDPVPYEAIRNVENNTALVSKVFKTLFNVAHLADFNILSVTIRDNKTGKIYRS